MDKLSAMLTALGAVTAAQLVGGQRRPSPDQPKTALWYASLRKPSYTPPPMGIALAWTGLSGLLAYSGYRLLRSPPSAKRTQALVAWSANLAGIAGFSWVLFGSKRLDEALGVSGFMLASSVAAVGTAARVDGRAAMATVPLVLWTGFATLLQERIWEENRS